MASSMEGIASSRLCADVSGGVLAGAGFVAVEETWSSAEVPSLPEEASLRSCVGERG